MPKWLSLLKGLGLPSIAIAIAVSVWMIGTYPVKDGLTSIQLFHNHASKYVVINREAVQVAVDSTEVRDDIKSLEFKVYLKQNQIYKIMELERLTDTERKVMQKKAEDDLKRLEADLIDAEKKRGKIAEKWKNYAVAVHYSDNPS